MLGPLIAAIVFICHLNGPWIEALDVATTVLLCTEALALVLCVYKSGSGAQGLFVLLVGAVLLVSPWAMHEAVQNCTSWSKANQPLFWGGAVMYLVMLGFDTVKRR